MAYIKPLSPIKSGEDFIYPLTSYDQIIMEDGSRWNGTIVDSNIVRIDLEDAEEGTPALTNADMLGNRSAEEYALKSEVEGLTGGIQMELLWENADAALSFPEQILNIPELVNYEYINVIYWAGGDRGYNSSGIVKKGKVVLPVHGNTCGERTLTTSGANISVSACVEYTVYGAATTATINHYSVPAFIYGIKGVS